MTLPLNHPVADYKAGLLDLSGRVNCDALFLTPMPSLSVPASVQASYIAAIKQVARQRRIETVDQHSLMGADAWLTLGMSIDPHHPSAAGNAVTSNLVANKIQGR